MTCPGKTKERHTKGIGPFNDCIPYMRVLSMKRWLQRERELSPEVIQRQIDIRDEWIDIHDVVCAEALCHGHRS